MNRKLHRRCINSSIMLINCSYLKHIEGHGIDQFQYYLMKVLTARFVTQLCFIGLSKHCKNRMQTYNLQGKDMIRAQNGDGDQTADMKR